MTQTSIPWANSYPSHWSITRIKYLARPERGGFTDGDWIETPFITPDGVRLIQCGNVGTGEYIEQGFKYISEASMKSLNCTEVDPNDVLICRMRSSARIRAGRACVVPDLGCRMVTAVDNCILKPKPNVDPRFVVYQLSAPFFLDYVEGIARGGTRDRISRRMLGDFFVLLPSLDEQQAIASFLDRKTAKIDELIRRKHRINDLLMQKLRASQSIAVTNGIEKRTPRVLSRSPCIPSSPSHWQVLPLRRVLRRIEQGWSPQCDGRPASPDEWGVLKAGCVNSGVLDESENKVLPAAIAPELAYQVREGDVLMSRACGTASLVGSVAFVKECRSKLLLCDKVFRLHPNKKRILPQYLAEALKSSTSRAQIEQSLSGADGLANNITQATIKTLVIPVPPLHEQQEICDEIERCRNQLQAVIEVIQTAIQRLQRYRATLISAAVTGQIGVRNHRAEVSA